MASFTFTTVDDFGGKTTLEFDGLILSDVLERFVSFLLCAGYRFDGKIDFVEDSQSEKCGGNCAGCSCSQGEAVFSNMVDNWPNLKESKDDIFIGGNDVELDISQYGAAQPFYGYSGAGVDTITVGGLNDSISFPEIQIDLTDTKPKSKNANKR